MQLTTAEPTATPPAVAAICLNNDGCWGAAIDGWAIADGAGGAWAGTLLWVWLGADEYVLENKTIHIYYCPSKVAFRI